MIAPIRVVILSRSVLWRFFGKCNTPKALDDDEQSLERRRLDVVDVVTLFKG
jgi:hypothetical protein